ncbi:MAG: helix-turn-helix domain-containing protein [Clostridia bacterium]|nr:helix-turn-helix domain-containing protein [Clostridia bacterium]
MDIIERIHQLREERGWSVNNLAMEAELTQSTLSSMLGRNSAPKIDTLQCICNAFGITLSQFFLEDENIEILTEKEKELITAYRKLPESKQKALFNLIEN